MKKISSSFKLNKFTTKLTTKFTNSFKFNFSTLIVPQINNGKIHSSILNMTTAANQLSQGDLSLLLYGNEISNSTIDQAKNLPHISKIYTYSNSNFTLNEPSAEVLSSLVSTIHSNISQFDNIISSVDNFGKNFIPRIGGLLNVQPISEISSIENNTTFKRYYYAGNALTKVHSEQKPNIMTIRLTSFDKSEGENNPNIAVEDLSSNNSISDVLSKIRTSRFEENITSNSDKIELSQAKVVVSGGRALKSAENFKLVENLAECFEGAAIGASRAAVDAGYVPNELQVGQTGKTVAPNLYFAIGISGAIQHVAGMKDSKVIVAINSDADSPIFNIATYGLIGDLFKILPELTEKINAAKS